MRTGYSIPRLLSDGTLIYPKRGMPPPVPEGYRRKSEILTSPDAWIMLPLWIDCLFRIRETIKREDCRCFSYAYFCGHPEQSRLELTVSLCENCQICKAK